MDYLPLFSIHITHGYYANKKCADFSVEPTPDCHKNIRGHRLLLKKHADGITVVAPADASGKPFIPLSTTLKFKFYLTLRNSDVLSFTRVEQQPDNSSIYRFTNANLKRPGPAELERLRVQRADLPTPGGRSIWGVVDIINNASVPAELTQPSEFTIAFDSKKQHWTYYVLTGQEADGAEYVIEDKGPSPTPRIKFKRTDMSQAVSGAESDSVLEMLATRFPHTPTLKFRSTAAVASQEVRRKNIQLLKKKGRAKTVWIDHLPNPPNHNGTKVINLAGKPEVTDTSKQSSTNDG